MTGLKVCAFGCALMIASAAAAQSKDQYSFYAVTDDGFEIKSVAQISMEATRQINPKATGEGVVVTLQKGKVVAVCYFALINWIYMAEASMKDETLCEVR